MKRTFVYLVLALLSIQLSASCGRKTMNERDVRREQLRINAHQKRQEMAGLVGNYRGTMTDSVNYKQDVIVRLELKDVPETQEGQVDPVLVPTVSGGLSLTYGQGEKMELFNFGATKSDYNASDATINLVVSNAIFKDLNLSMRLNGVHLDGTWSSPTTSTSGQIELSRTADLTLGGETPPLTGLYQGILSWATKSLYTKGELSFATSKDTADTFHVTANLKVTLPTKNSFETFLYEFDSVEFNPLSRQVSVKSDVNDLYFVGQLNGQSLQGSWHSKRTGLIGPAQFSLTPPAVPADRLMATGATGLWYGKVQNTRPDSHLPELMMLTFNGIPDQNHSGGISLIGSARLYYGEFSSPEFLEYRFDTTEYLPFTRKIAGIDGGAQKLTFKIDMLASELSGQIIDASLGEVASFTLSRNVPQIGGGGGDGGPGGGTELAGEYNGYAAYAADNTYQTTKINLVPSISPGGVKLAASVIMQYGDTVSGESISYRFDDADLNSVSGLLTLSNPASDIVVKAILRDGVITGDWFSTSLGKMGPLVACKNTAAQAPTTLRRLDTTKGTYRGSLKNESSATNLPERIMFGLISSLDQNAPRGLKITGNLRLYYGPYEGNDYVELPFESTQFDPFRRTITAKTAGALKLTVQGLLSSDGKINGSLSDDSLGKIGTFAVAK